jgi:hypothetical protein
MQQLVDGVALLGLAPGLLGPGWTPKVVLEYISSLPAT